MKKILSIGVAFFSVFINCNAQKNSIIEFENNGSIEKMELLFRNNDEVISKPINKEYWETILNIIKTSEYDNEQYDEIKNPSRYMLKIIKQDYVLKIFYTNNTFDTILVWIGSDRIAINGEWYTIKDGIGELFNIIDLSM